HVQAHQPRGTIPACAGSTSLTDRPESGDRDHPRVRGEHGAFRFGGVVGKGPSPRARGAPVLPPWFVEEAGTIPACAGSTTTSRPSPTSSRDHPRVRGEHGMGYMSDDGAQGPSPRARGALSARARRYTVGG